MMRFRSIDDFLRHLETLPALIAAAEKRGLEEAGRGLVIGAQAMIGQEIREWAPLAASTVLEKDRLGYTGRISATDPLYRTGELRVSISFQWRPHTVVLGSDDPIAPYQEFGTSTIPPRPFIGATMFRDGHAAAELVVGHVMAAIGSLPAPERHPNSSLGDEWAGGL